MRHLFLFILFLILFCPLLSAQEIIIETTETTEDSSVITPQPLPPSQLEVKDAPNDAGRTLILTWKLSDDDPEHINSYQIYRFGPLKDERTPALDEFELIYKVPAGTNQYINDALEPNKNYYYYLTAKDTVLSSPTPIIGPIKPQGQWFNTTRINALVGTIIFFALVLTFIQLARKGAKLYIRQIAGIAAVDEALGRATEMGKPILFVPGLSSISDVSTIAALTILGRVAQKAAEYDTPIIVPNSDPIVMTVAQEVVKEAYYNAGRPDAYRSENVFFVAGSQFSYVGAVNGIMMREKPATNFYMGMFFAESLMLAETGAATGAIQIAGTDAVTQLPFFITSCDYTLIGEELYAASAYLSREPMLLGSLKGQDLAKAVIMILITIGVLLATFTPNLFEKYVALFAVH